MRAEKVVKYTKEEMRRQQEDCDKRRQKDVTSESSLAASLATMNLDVNNAANDDPDPVSKDGVQVQIPLEEVTVTKKKLVTLHEE